MLQLVDSGTNNDVTASYPSNYDSPNVIAVHRSQSSGIIKLLSSLVRLTVDYWRSGFCIWFPQAYSKQVERVKELTRKDQVMQVYMDINWQLHTYLELLRFMLLSNPICDWLLRLKAGHFWIFRYGLLLLWAGKNGHMAERLNVSGFKSIN